MQRLEVSGAVRPIYGSLGVKRLISLHVRIWSQPKIILDASGLNCPAFWLWQKKKCFKISESKEISSFVNYYVQWLGFPTAASCGAPWLVEEGGETKGWKRARRLYENFEGIWPTEGKNGGGIVPETTGVGDKMFPERVYNKPEFIWTSQTLWTGR